MPVHRVIIQHARDISNRIAADLGVRHESPQLIYVKDGQAVWSVSHHQVRPDELTF